MADVPVSESSSVSLTWAQCRKFGTFESFFHKDYLVHQEYITPRVLALALPMIVGLVAIVLASIELESPGSLRSLFQNSKDAADVTFGGGLVVLIISPVLSYKYAEWIKPDYVRSAQRDCEISLDAEKEDADNFQQNCNLDPDKIKERNGKVTGATNEKAINEYLQLTEDIDEPYKWRYPINNQGQLIYNPRTLDKNPESSSCKFYTSFRTTVLSCELAVAQLRGITKSNSSNSCAIS